MQRRVEDYRGRVIAVDASLSIYQFLVSPHASPPPLSVRPLGFSFLRPFTRVVSRRCIWVQSSAEDCIAAGLDFSDDVMMCPVVSNLV